MENEQMVDGADAMFERLGAAVERLEQMIASQAAVGPIVATVENAREAELEQRLAEAEATIAQLRAGGAEHAASAGRKTVSMGAVSLLAKQGMSVERTEAGALDTALSSLSIEQRIAVKSELMRAGLLG